MLFTNICILSISNSLMFQWINFTRRAFTWVISADNKLMISLLLFVFLFPRKWDFTFYANLHELSTPVFSEKNMLAIKHAWTLILKLYLQTSAYYLFSVLWCFTELAFTMLWANSADNKLMIFMLPPFEEWWKRHIVLPLSVSVPVPDDVSNLSLSFSGVSNLRFSFSGRGIHVLWTHFWFSYFSQTTGSQKTGFNISCKLSPLHGDNLNEILNLFFWVK